MLIFAAAFAALPVFAETIAYSTPKDFKPGQVKATADGLQIVKRSWTLGTKKVAFDPAAKYKLTLDIRAKADDIAKLGKYPIRIGLAPFSADYKILSPSNIFIIDGSDTELAAPVKPGDKVIKVKDAFKWSIGSGTVVAFDCDPSGKLRDLPNYNSLGYIAKVNRATGEITLSRPAKVSLDAGTAVRQHQNSWSVIGNDPCHVTTQWQTFTVTTIPGVCNSVKEKPRYRVWKYTAFLEPLIATTIPVEIRNVKIEIIK